MINRGIFHSEDTNYFYVWMKNRYIFCVYTLFVVLCVARKPAIFAIRKLI